MKIKNLSDKELKLPMKKSSGQKIIVILAPGQIVYSEAEKKHENKQLVIWERKKLIEITNDTIPQKLEYCHPYNTIKKPVVPTIALSEDFDDDQDDNLEPLITIPKLSKEEEDEDGNIDDDDDGGYGDDKDDGGDDDNDDNDDSGDNDNVDAGNTNVAPAKNKGGRPKGAKNKPKKKKSKRTAVKNPSNNNSDSNAI